MSGGDHNQGEGRRGACRDCGRVLTLNKDGGVRHHVNKDKPMDGPWRPRCTGSGWYPQEVSS